MAAIVMTASYKINFVSHSEYSANQKDGSLFFEDNSLRTIGEAAPINWCYFLPALVFIGQFL
jgi:hypothetical protein